MKVDNYEKAAKDYIEQLRNLPPKEAKLIASQNLKEIGVLNDDGTIKKQIVNGDFFGY